MKTASAPSPRRTTSQQKFLLAAVFVAMMLNPTAATAQRMVFASPDPSPDPTSPTIVAQVPSGPDYGPQTYSVPGTASPYTVPSSAAPAVNYPPAGASPTMTPFGYAGPDGTQGYSPPQPTTGIWTAPGTVPTAGNAPVVTFNGNVQPLPQQPSPTWDPYASPGAVTAPLLAPPQQYDPNAGQGPCAPPPQSFLAVPSQFPVPEVFAPAQRFIQGVSINYVYLPGNGGGSNQLGDNYIDLQSSFALPFFGWGQEPPIIVTPGFTFNFWNGPASQGANGADMPGQTYDAYLDTAWNPQVAPGLGAELEFRIGVNSDFTKIESESIRLSGKGLAVIDIPQTNFKFKAGVWYTNYVDIKLLPAGGFVWTPSPYTEIDILFPNPRITQYLTTVGQTEWWWYVMGIYGGDTWTIKRSGSDAPGVANTLDLVSYEDIRVAVGLDFRRGPIVNGHIEGGYAFERELLYLNGPPSSYRPNGVFYVGAGLTF